MINGITNYSLNKKPRSTVSFGAKAVPKGIAKNFERILLNAESIDLHTHARPDADGCGALIALYLWLVSKGKKVSICLKEADLKDLYFPLDKSVLKKGEEASKVAVVVDCNGRERIYKKFVPLLKQYNPKNIIVIDHHKPMSIPIIANPYLDATAKSCCSIIYRLFEQLQVKPSSKSRKATDLHPEKLTNLPSEALKSLYCGILSDFGKAGIISLKSISNGFSLNIKFARDKNSKEVWRRISSQVSAEDKAEIYELSDILSNLTPLEKSFQKRLCRNLRITSDGIASVKIPFSDFLWEKLGGKTTRTAEILRNFRIRILKHNPNDELLNESLTSAQKENLKHVQIIFVYYPVGKTYKLSAHSKSGLFGRVQKDMPEMPNVTLGGHPCRGGGSVIIRNTRNPQRETSGFIARIRKATENVLGQYRRSLRRPSPERIKTTKN